MDYPDFHSEHEEVQVKLYSIGYPMAKDLSGNYWRRFSLVDGVVTCTFCQKLINAGWKADSISACDVHFDLTYSGVLDKAEWWILKEQVNSLYH